MRTNNNMYIDGIPYSSEELLYACEKEIKNINGNDLIEFGYKPGPHFAEMLRVAEGLVEHNLPMVELRSILDEIYAEATFVKDTIPLQEGLVYDMFLDEGNNEYEIENVAAVKATMNEVVKTPTVIKAVVMPDACPAGPIGTIPVGGVVATKNAIHPGMHSADICCSMFLTSLDQDFDVSLILDKVQEHSHFGVGGRKDLPMGHGHEIIKRAEKNRFLASVQMLKAMSDHHGTQGDGNHFFYVGRKESTGELTLVTHHGSRKPGALLYKQGMRVAEQFRQEISPDTLKQNAWIPYDTDEGHEYWEALQIIRAWTKYNHEAIHDLVMSSLGMNYRNITDRFWNEHNFVFKKGDLFYHAKGSTPVFGHHAHDADGEGRTIVPLNMGEDILIIKNHKDNDWGFAPHGAGRNYSRTKFKKLQGSKTVSKIMAEQVGHIDARFYTGDADVSELPGAYKNADEVIKQIEKYKLANIVDRLKPLGSMMAGEVEQFWRKKK